MALTGLLAFDPVTGTGFSEVDGVGNAGSGELKGVDFGFSHFARWAPGLLSALFATPV